MERTILFDFDRTLIDTDALKIIQAQKVADIAELTFDQVQDSMRSFISTLPSNLDFTPQGYAMHLQLLWGVNPSDVLKIYITDANYIRDSLFSDVKETLSELSKSFTLGIYSESQPYYQRLKIANTGVLEFMNESKVIVVPRKREQKVLGAIAAGTIIVDDDLQVISAILENAAHLVPIWINRKTAEKHATVTTIHGLADLLQLDLLH